MVVLCDGAVLQEEGLSELRVVRLVRAEVPVVHRLEHELAALLGTSTAKDPALERAGLVAGLDRDRITAAVGAKAQVSVDNLDKDGVIGESNPLPGSDQVSLAVSDVNTATRSTLGPDGI